MLKELFDYVLDNYNNGYKNAERTDPNFAVITQQIPIVVMSPFPMRNDLLATGSCGIGQKTDFPWIAIFNKRITTSAKRGIDIVYLFKKDLSGFYLSLNQGITYFADTYKKNKYKYARKVADYFRNEINDTYFDRTNIDLGGNKGTLGYGYQETNIISKYYAKGEYDDDILFKDLQLMVKIYDELAGVLGEINYDYNLAINNIVFGYDDAFESAVDGIDNIKKAIASPTDINIVRTLKYVEPKVKRTSKYSKVRSSGAVKKIDYIQKAKTDAEVGLLGELLALSYEREKLIREGQQELADKIRRVSVESDRFGYDIESYERIGLRYEKVYIEVKTTTNKLDVDFPVTRNEVDQSKDYGDHYCLFRIYDAKSVNPSFYKVFGKIEDNFELDPVSFLASYKGNKNN